MGDQQTTPFKGKVINDGIRSSMVKGGGSQRDSQVSIEKQSYNTRPVTSKPSPMGSVRAHSPYNKT